MPAVQVLIPCYNYAQYLEACVDSALTQTGVEVRVLVIDDCSTDNTPEVCARLAQRDPRVRYLRHAQNKGHIATYNEGIGLSEGDYFVLLSADDLLVPGALARATALMEAHPAVGFVYGTPITLYDAEAREPRVGEASWTVWEGRDWIEKMCRTGKNFIDSPETVMRLSLQRQLVGYNPALPHSGDMELWIRAAAVAKVGHVNGTDQAYYRVHGASMQRTVHSGVLFDLEGRRLAFESAFQREAADLPGAVQLLSMARRSLAVLALRHARGALDRGELTPEALQACCDFAVAVAPAIASSRQWRRLQRAAHKTPGPLHDVVSRARRFSRRVEDHLAWRRWYATGCF